MLQGMSFRRKPESATTRFSARCSTTRPSCRRLIGVRRLIGKAEMIGVEDEDDWILYVPLEA